MHDAPAELTQKGRAPEVAAHMERWRSYLESGLAGMTRTGELAADTDPRTLSFAVLAAIQGGLTLSAMTTSIEPLEAALDGAIATLRANAAPATEMWPQ